MQISFLSCRKGSDRLTDGSEATAPRDFGAGPTENIWPTSQIFNFSNKNHEIMTKYSKKAQINQKNTIFSGRPLRGPFKLISHPATPPIPAHPPLLTRPLGQLLAHMRTCAHAHMRTCAHAHMRS